MCGGVVCLYVSTFRFSLLYKCTGIGLKNFAFSFCFVQFLLLFFFLLDSTEQSGLVFARVRIKMPFWSI